MFLCAANALNSLILKMPSNNKGNNKQIPFAFFFLFLPCCRCCCLFHFAVYAQFVSTFFFLSFSLSLSYLHNFLFVYYACACMCVCVWEWLLLSIVCYLSSYTFWNCIYISSLWYLTMWSENYQMEKSMTQQMKKYEASRLWVFIYFILKTSM